MTTLNHMTSPPATPGRRIELDFIRGIAILLVMGSHYTFMKTDSWFVDTVSEYLKSNGGIGVNLFFALSGYLVGGLLMAELQRTGEVNATRFLVRRAFKIWPPLYFLVLVHIVIGRHPIESFAWQNLLHVQNYFGSSLAPTWSLAVEEHFYIFLALVLSLLAARPPKAIIGVMVGLGLLSFLARWAAVDAGMLDAAFRQTQFRMDSLLYGVILAAVQRFHPTTFKRLEDQRWLLVALSSVAFIVAELLNQDPAMERIVGYAAQGISFCALIVLVCRYSGEVTRFRVYRGVAWIGVYSYGIYLWHTISLEPGRKLIAWAQSSGIEVHVAWFGTLAAQCAAGIAVGYVTTRLVEFPALALRERLFPPSPQGSTSTATHAPFWGTPDLPRWRARRFKRR